MHLTKQEIIRFFRESPEWKEVKECLKTREGTLIRNLKTLRGENLDQKLGLIQGELILIDYILDATKLESELKGKAHE